MNNVTLHHYSGQNNNGGGRFICSECYNEMHTEYGEPSCVHRKLSQYNPIIDWEGVKDWIDAIVADFNLGPHTATLSPQGHTLDWQLRDTRLLSQLLVNELRTKAEIESIFAQAGRSLPRNVLDTQRLHLLRQSSMQKVSALEGLIQFGVRE
tara:strand:- start:72 stop:527 length:456 start_codon:yes stop_codon:yes gene_type:complete